MTVNGKEINLSGIECTTLIDLINYYNLDPESIAVERNGEVPLREKWSEIHLENSDRIELIKFVGGG